MTIELQRVVKTMRHNKNINKGHIKRILMYLNLLSFV